VATDELNARTWWRTGVGAKRMIVEYSKYLVILAREGVLSLGPKDRAEPPAKPAAAKAGAPESAPAK